MTKADYVSNIGANPPANQQATFIENTEFNSYQYDAVGNRLNEKVKTQTRKVGHKMTREEVGGPRLVSQMVREKF